MDPDTGATPVRPRRRFIGVALGFLVPGLGHYAVGHLRRALAWYGAWFVVFLGMVVAGLAGQPWVMCCGLGATAAVILGSPFDTLRLPRPATLPRSLWVLVLLGAMVTVHVFAAEWLKANVMEAFMMSRPGAHPAIEPGDRFIVAKFPRAFERGDLVALRAPHRPEVVLLKRVMGVESDTVEMRERLVLVNGQALPRRRLPEPCSFSREGAACVMWEEELDGKTYRIATTEGSSGPGDFDAVQVPEGQVFVLGDPRDETIDSRFWGPVPLDAIVGRAAFVWWSSGPKGIRWERLNMAIR